MSLRKTVSAIAFLFAMTACNGVTVPDAKVLADTKIDFKNSNNVDLSGSKFNFDLKSLNGIVGEVIGNNAEIITESGEEKILDIENLPSDVRSKITTGANVSIVNNQDSVDIEINKESFRQINDLVIEENEGAVSFVITESYTVTGTQTQDGEIICTNETGESIALDSGIIGDAPQGSSFVIRKNKGKVDLKIGDTIKRDIDLKISDNQGNVSFKVTKND